jgi:hypothetical protein
VTASLESPSDASQVFFAESSGVYDLVGMHGQITVG